MHTYKNLICILLGAVAMVAYAMSKFISGRGIVLLTTGFFLGFLVALVLVLRASKDLAAAVKAASAIMVVAILDTYLVLFFVVYSFQDIIANKTGTFFQPQSLPASAVQYANAPRIEIIEIITRDGVHLRGWLLHNSDEGLAPLIIYFGGSGSESSEMIPDFQAVEGWSVALVNYRGFGESEGRPSRDTVTEDALALYDAFARRPDIDSQRIIAMGYSLGTGVAVHLSANRPTAGTILAAPYDSITLVGIKRPPIYAPLTPIMRRYFDSAALAPDIPTPALFLIGAEDQAVPPERSLLLAGRWAGPTTEMIYPEEDHGLLTNNQAVWADITAFLEEFTHEPDI